MAWWNLARPTHRPVVQLYTREGCHLCHEVQALLEAERTSLDFDLSVVDIDQDPEAGRQYDLEVPVVTVNGRLRFRGKVNLILLRRTLRGAGARARR